MFQLSLALVAIVVICIVEAQHLPFILNVEDVGPREITSQTFRLPNNTRPETYDISIRTWIHEANFTFTGSVRIEIGVVESTDFITLHHRVQSIESVRVLSEDQIPVEIGHYSYDLKFEFLTIPVAGTNLIAGARYFIEINYVGSMNTVSGFYRSYYNIDGVQRWFGSTQFEPTDARSAFPCYDELALKSNFTIRVTHDSSYSAISNMPATSETPIKNPDGSITTIFETTPKMSTYLVSFLVSDFSYVTNSPPPPIPQRTFSRPNAINQNDVALEAGELLLEALSEYVGIEYSLPKMDQVGVPGFPVSAMENWGLVTYDEYYFLFDERVNRFTRSLSAVLTISHELAHQWFGNLVTPRWWTYLWMKEGFATLFEYLGVDLIYPEWNMMDYFVVDVIHNVFNLEASEFSRPMTYYVEHPYDIDEQFNPIAYEKAASVLRMFWYMFGQETFMRGVTSYILANAHSDAAEEELFEALDFSVHLDEEIIIPRTVNVSTIMSSWTRQAGFPLITVERNYVDRTDQIILRQQRYYTYDAPIDPYDSSWWVPYNFATPQNPGFENTRVEGWIPQNTTSLGVVVDSLGANDYLLMNKQAAGYYRIMYDERNYRLLSDAILRNSSLFHATNKAQLLNDVYALIETDRLPYTPLLDLMRVLEFDSNFVSWSPLFSAIWFINDYMQGHRNYPIWEDFVRSLTEHLYDTVGIDDISDEPILQKFSRQSVIQLACQMGSVHCRNDANRQLRQHMVTGREFNQNIRQPLLCASMRSANRNEFHFMWNRMMSYGLYEYTPRSEIITALGCSTSRKLLNEFLRSSLNSTNKNNVEYSRYEPKFVLKSVVSNGGNTGLDLTLEFLNENAVEAYQTYGIYVVTDIAYIVSRADHVERFRTFENTLLEAGLIRQHQIEHNKNRIAKRVKWLDTHGEVINSWLMKNYV